MMFRSIHKRLSNLYVQVIDYNGTTYSSVEQAFQFQKSIVCANKAVGKLIMENHDPYKIMTIAKRVKDCEMG